MVQSNPESDRLDFEVEIEEIGKNIKPSLSKKTNTMRLIECPRCNKRFIINNHKATKYVRCSCQSKIKLAKRWYD